MLSADFCIQAEYDPLGRHFSPHLAGGALLDVGVYPISLASMLFGTPKEIIGLSDIGKTGVDEQSGMVLSYGDGKLAVLACSLIGVTEHDAQIVGSDGQIKIHSSWWKPSTMTVSTKGKSEEISFPYESTGYQFQVEEVGHCLRAGKTESAIMPLDETLEIMRTMDTLRAQWGLKYPMEAALAAADCL
jgi:predicted dehydrogenase